MTHIVAGKLIDKVFLMSDCISTNNGHSFTNKLYKLESESDTYFAMSGNNFIFQWILALDLWLAQNRNPISNDFCSGTNDFNLFMSLLPHCIDNHPKKEEFEYRDNRLFFIDRQNVKFYNIVTDENTFLKSGQSGSLNINEFVDSLWGRREPKPLPLNDEPDLFESCLRYINNTSAENLLDFKGRFSYIVLDATGVVDNRPPFHSFSDVYSFYSSFPFERIDELHFPDIM